MDAALFDAVRSKDDAHVRQLLAGAPSLAHARDAQGMRILRFAIYMRAAQAIAALLAAGAEPDIHEACCLGDAARVRDLATQQPALLHEPASDGPLPLHLAAHFGQREIAKLLLELGADVDALAGGVFANRPLHAAAAGRSHEAIALLLEAGADPDARDRNGYTALHIAAANGLAPAVGLLLAHGASREARGADGRTPLDFALERKHAEAAALLRAQP